MPTGISYRIGMDASQFLAGGRQVEASARDMSKAIADAFGQKLKTLISVAAVEEAARRTGEWASEITQTSKALGITAEQLQTLQIIASKTGTSQSAVEGMFTNIKNAAEAALQGNSEMIASFAKLGVAVTRADTAGTIFSKTMDALAKNPLVSANGSNSDTFYRQAAQAVTGTPENVVQGFVQGWQATPGADLTGKGGRLKDEGNVGSNESIQAIAATWSSIKTELSEAGTQLLPLADLLLNIVKVFVQAIAGLAESFGGVVDIIGGIITGDMDRIGKGLKTIFGMLANAVLGIVRMIPDLAGGVLHSLGRVASHFHLKKTGEWLSDSGTAMNIGTEYGLSEINRNNGFSSTSAERGQAMGNVAAMIATGGEVAVAEGSKLPFVGKYIAKLKKFTKSGKLDLAADKVISKFDEEFNDTLKIINVKRGKNPGEYVDATTGEPLSKESYASLKRMEDRKDAKIKNVNLLRGRVAGRIMKEGATAAIAGAGGINALNAMKGTVGAAGAPQNSTLLPALMQAMTPTASGGGNLKIGGMFGAGEIRIIKMTQKMIDLLSQIQLNTSPWNGRAATTTGGANPVGHAGGQ